MKAAGAVSEASCAVLGPWDGALGLLGRFGPSLGGFMGFWGRHAASGNPKRANLRNLRPPLRQ
eukprot:9321409-Pyramimonas_sp.AAC.1